MYYRIGDYLLNLNEIGAFHIFQQSSGQQAQLQALGVGGAIFTGTREEVEAKLQEIQDILEFGSPRAAGKIALEAEPEPEPEPEEEVVESDAADDEPEEQGDEQ